MIASALVEDTTRINGVPLNMVWDVISGCMRMDILPDIKRKIMGWRNRFWALCVPSSNEPIMFTIASAQASRWADDDISAHDASHDIIMVVPKHARVTLTTLSIDNENTDNDWSTNDLRTQLLFLSHECAYHAKPRQMQEFLQAKAWWPAQLQAITMHYDNCPNCKPFRKVIKQRGVSLVHGGRFAMVFADHIILSPDMAERTGCQAVGNMCDISSKFVVAGPTATTSSDDFYRMLTIKWIQ